jgi:hypothetical protein
VIYGASAAAARPRAFPDDPRAPNLSLLQAFVIFTRRLSPRLLVGSLVLAATLRAWVGDLGLWDLVLFGSLVALQPFSEWVIHVAILHWRPRRIFGVMVDSYLSWSHREHHKRPNDEAWWFIPLRSGIVGFVIIGAVGAIVLRDLGLWITLMFTATSLGLVYEWTHYLCHSSYRPRSGFYRRIWRHHRLHHFKNEHYWMGVSRHLADWVLGTNPDQRDVDPSPTCRDLFGTGNPERDGGA